MEFRSHISESAFLVNESRARKVALSLDRYAHLWVSDETRRLWEDFSNEVYPYDEIELGARNRFFLERVDSFARTNPGAVFVNYGAGFTSYPFLTDTQCRCIEVDYEHVVAFKSQKIAQWRHEGILPDRKVEFCATDLTSAAERERLRNTLQERIAGSPSIFMMEGITYYLDSSVLGELLKMFAGLQSEGSQLALDFWTPDVVSHPIFIRFREFFERRFGHGGERYNLLEVGFVRSIPGYELVELTDIQELEKVYSDTRLLSKYDEILPENYAVLRRTPPRARGGV
jgi:O-methyltransferase involved in polyketide biosynthesis